MKKIIIAIATIFLGVLSVEAQSKITINTLEIGEKYTQEKIFSALGGQPTKTRSSRYDDAYEKFFVYYYGNNAFGFSDGVFYDFTIVNTNYKVNGNLSVGERISAADKLITQPGQSLEDYPEGLKGYKLLKFPEKTGVYSCLYFQINYTNILSIKCITSISCSINDL